MINFLPTWLTSYLPTYITQLPTYIHTYITYICVVNCRSFASVIWPLHLPNVGKIGNGHGEAQLELWPIPWNIQRRNPSSGFKDIRSSPLTGPYWTHGQWYDFVQLRVWTFQILHIFGPQASPCRAIEQMNEMLLNYRSRQLNRTSK